MVQHTTGLQKHELLIQRDLSSGLFGFDITHNHVLWVIPGLPAAKAGLCPFDRIVALNNYKITCNNIYHVLPTIYNSDIIYVTVIRTVSDTLYDKHIFVWHPITIISKYGLNINVITKKSLTLSAVKRRRFPFFRNICDKHENNDDNDVTIEHERVKYYTLIWI